MTAEGEPNFLARRGMDWTVLVQYVTASLSGKRIVHIVKSEIKMLRCGLLF